MAISLEQLKELFASDRAQEAQQIIEREFLFTDEPLYRADGQFVEENWVQVDEPITLANLSWQAWVLRLLPTVESLTPPLVFSAVRLVPPPELKTALAEPVESEAHKEASETVTKALSSTEMARLKLNLVRLFEEGLYKGDQYLLFPTPTLYALQARFQYDVVIPFISLKSLDPKIEQ